MSNKQASRLALYLTVLQFTTAYIYKEKEKEGLKEQFVVTLKN